MTGPSHHRALRGGAAAVVGLRYRRKRFGLDMAGRSARACDPHEDVTEAVIQPLDVRQHAHRPMVLAAGGPAVPQHP